MSGVLTLGDLIDQGKARVLTITDLKCSGCGRWMFENSRNHHIICEDCGLIYKSREEFQSLS